MALVTVFVLASICSGCGGRFPRGAAKDPSAWRGFRQKGIASYYSDRLAGRATASGEAYDPRQLTGAHRRLAFGTLVRVRGADGREVQVRINDRGPFVRGRIIDVSRRAAEALGMMRKGIIPVSITVPK